MNRAPVVLAATAAVLAVGIGWRVARTDTPPQPVVRPTSASTSTSTSASAGGAAPSAALGMASGPMGIIPMSNVPAPGGPVVAEASQRPLGSGQVPVFKTTPRGDLAIDHDTRIALERVLALNDRPDAQALLREAAASLSPAAARQLIDAANNFSNYQAALTQTLPPGQPPADARDALQQLEALHALRVQQLGPEVAAAYFGSEEASSRQLIAEMVAQGQLPPDPAAPAGSAPR